MVKSILILNWRCPSNPLSGGAEKVTLEHAAAWVKKGVNVSWLAGGYKGGKNIETIRRVNIYRFGNSILIYLLAPFIYWIKFKGNFDLVIDEIHGIPFLSVLWAWKSKKIAYIHEVAQEIWDEMLPFPVNFFGKLYEKIYFLFYKNTPFITGSNSTKNDLINFGIDAKNIYVIPHGLFLKPVKKLPLKEKSLTLLYVSRLVKMKGIEDAIKIFSEILKKDVNAQFWIVGRGEKNYIYKLQLLIKNLGIEKSVIFFDFVAEHKKVELFQKAHFLLHTSIREGFGLVVIEANSQGTPVLAYSSPGLRDVIINGINGYIFSREEKDLIVNKSIALFNNLKYNDLVYSAINSSKNYNWTATTNQSFHLLLSLIRKKN